jgi:two-component system nitrate/nitrite response regulator NarL
MMKKIRLTIVDDHTLFAEGIQSLLKEEPNIEIVNILNDGRNLIKSIEKDPSDLVLLDISLPGMNGLEAAKILREHHPGLKIIMLSTYNEAHLIEKAKSYGANGYMLKSVSKEELIQAINQVCEGKNLILEYHAESINEFQQSDGFLKQFQLTKRELEIIQLIKKHYTNQQISKVLYLSIFTVETHRKNIMKKLGINNPSHLIRFIIEKGL